MVDSLKWLMEQEDFPEGECWHREHHKANASIFRSNEDGDRVYLIVDGAVKILGDLTLASGDRTLSRLSVLHRNEVFGEFCLFDYEPRSATVSASEDCEVVVFHKNALLEYCEAHKDFGYAMLREIMKLLVRRMRANNEKILDLTAQGLKCMTCDYDEQMKRQSG